MMQDYALLRPVGTDRRSARSGVRQAAAFVAAGSLLAALLVVAATGSMRPVETGESAVSADLNDKFLQASGSGPAGNDFLSRLQDIWFVESNGGRADLAADATEMATSLLVAGFPGDMKEAIDVKTNPCDDFYEFACGKWDAEHSDKIADYKSQVAFSWDRADKNIRTSMTKILQEDAGPAGAYYRSCMDLDHIEAVGDTQLQPWIKFVDAISDKAGLVTAMTEVRNQDICSRTHAD